MVRAMVAEVEQAGVASNQSMETMARRFHNTLAR